MPAESVGRGRNRLALPRGVFHGDAPTHEVGPAQLLGGPCRGPGTGYLSGSILQGNTLPECQPSF